MATALKLDTLEQTEKEFFEMVQIIAISIDILEGSVGGYENIKFSK